MNTPTPYRVPAIKLLSAQPGIHLDVIYCTAPHIDMTLDAVAHGFDPCFLTGRYRVYERRFMHSDLGIAKVLSDLQPDVVITTGYIPTFLFAFLWAWWNGVRHIAMTDGTFKSEASLSWLHRLVRCFVLGRSAACLGACEGSLDLFRSYKVPEAALFKTPLAIDNSRFVEAAPPVKEVDFIFCGRFVTHKRPLFALELAAEVATRLGRKSSIDFVGAGVEEPAMRARAAELADKVDARFLGYLSQKELPECYRRARIFLFPSEWDPWGVVANEACAAGVPTLVSPHAGAAGELICDGINGFVRELDMEEWVTQAVTLLSDEQLHARMSAAALQKVAAFSFSEAAAGMAAAIRYAVPRRTTGEMQRPIVICSLMRAAGTTGVQTHVNAFTAHLEASGHAWRLVTPFDGPRIPLYTFLVVRRALEKLAKPAAVWLYRRGHAWLLRQALKKALRQSGPDAAIYAQCPVSADVALRLRSARQSVTLVVHFNESQADEWAGKGAIKIGGSVYDAIRAFEEEVLPRVDAVVFVSAYMRDRIVSRIPAVKVLPQAVIPNFVKDPGKFSAPNAYDADLVAIGSLEPRKNQGYILEILSAARELGHLMTLTLVGDGPDRNSLQEKARQLGVEGQVRFVGFVARASGLIRRHKAVIHTALIESFGIVLIEAMSYGKPVFASHVGGMPEVFDDRAEGRVLPLNDARRAAEILCSAFFDADSMSAMSAAARKRFVESFQQTVVANRLTGFLDASRRRKREPT